jgi:hypothetical protein
MRLHFTLKSSLFMKQTETNNAVDLRQLMGGLYRGPIAPPFSLASHFLNSKDDWWKRLLPKDGDRKNKKHEAVS